MNVTRIRRSRLAIKMEGRLRLIKSIHRMLVLKQKLPDVAVEQKDSKRAPCPSCGKAMPEMRTLNYDLCRRCGAAAHRVQVHTKDKHGNIVSYYKPYIPTQGSLVLERRHARLKFDVLPMTASDWLICVQPSTVRLLLPSFGPRRWSYALSL